MIIFAAIIQRDSILFGFTPGPELHQMLESGGLKFPLYKGQKNDDLYHYILEFRKGDKWGEFVAPRYLSRPHDSLRFLTLGLTELLFTVIATTERFLTWNTLLQLSIVSKAKAILSILL